jgi:ribonuclease-3
VPVRASEPDDFGFGAGVDESAPAPESQAGEPAGFDADGAPRRRRRRRGGRGRRRKDGPEGAATPAPAGEASFEPEPPATDDGFGAIAEEALGAAPAANAADRFAGGERPHRMEAVERHGRRERQERFAPPPAAAEPPPSDSRQPPPRPRESHGGAHDWFSPERLEACQRAIHYHFRDVSLLENALTHSSIKSHDRPSYERMEFLGDSVVGLVIAEYLYNLLPDCDEGELTKVKSMVVSTDGLADAAKACGLDRFLAVGRGILMKDTVPRSLVADVFEGVVGAVYLDRGYETVRLYILDLLRPHIEEALSDRGARNFKSVLQQVSQRDFGDTPYYEVLRESGPEHSRVFEVLAVVGRRRFGIARAPTKKEAEQAAAKLALQTILLEKSSRKSAPRRRRSR